MYRQRPRSQSVYRDAAYLLACNEQQACDWLASRPVTYDYCEGTPETPPESHVLEYILVRRRSPLIDLSLAQHGRSGTVVDRVYKRGNGSIRAVACANASLFCGDRLMGAESDHGGAAGRRRLWAVAERGPDADLKALCENPDLPSYFYSSLVSSWDGDQSEESKQQRVIALPADRFLRSLWYLADNPRLSTEWFKSRQRDCPDGFTWYRYNLLFTKCWRLALIAPVERRWEQSLSHLYERLIAPGKAFDDVNAVLERWLTADAVFLRAKIAAKFVEPTLEGLNSSDPALRYAFYGSFDPERREFRDLDWTEWDKRDPIGCEVYLDANQNVWRSARGRAKRRELLKARRDRSLFGDQRLWDEYHLNEREKQFRETHPEWFEEEAEKDAAETRSTEIASQIASIKAETERIQRRLGLISWLIAFPIAAVAAGLLAWVVQKLVGSDTAYGDWPAAIAFALAISVILAIFRERLDR